MENKKVELLNGLLEDLVEGKEFSASDASDLIGKEEALVYVFDAKSDMVKFNKGDVGNLRDNNT